MPTMHTFNSIDQFGHWINELALMNKDLDAKERFAIGVPSILMGSPIKV